MRSTTPLLIALALAAPATADEIRLVSGGRLNGRIVEQTADHVVIEVGPGRLTLPTDRIAGIERGRSALDAWIARRAAVDPADAEAWLSLALWARDQGLATQAREAFERVVQMQPANPIANAALGRVRLNGTWLSEDDAYRARGYVRYQGRWMTREEQAAVLSESRAAEDLRAARAEAAARVREAEARAREAEARAAAAEAATLPGPYSASPFGLLIGSTASPYDFPPTRPAAPPAPRCDPPQPERRTPRTRSIR